MKIVALGVLAVCSMAAQEKEAPPPLGTPKPFALPPVETYTLKNGMKVTLAQYGSVPIVSVGARMAFGHFNESAGQVWLSNLTTELMKEGTQTRTAAELANEAARMGGQLDVSAGNDESSVNLDVLSEFTADAVKLVADVLRHPKLPESELERVRGNLLRQLTVQLSTPQAQAGQSFAANLYPGHPYGRLFPTESQLKGFSIADARKFYAENAGAQRTHLYIVGRFDPAVKRTIEAAFQDWTAGPAVKRTPPSPVAAGRLVLIDRPEAVQSTLAIGLAMPIGPGDKDYVPLAVTNSLLGGAFTSRITNNIREQKGYTYSPRSQVAARYRTSYWEESADVTTKFTGDSIHEILFEIDRLRKEPPDAKELKGIQNLMGGFFVLQNSSNQGIIGQLSLVDLHGLPDDYLKTYIQKVNAVTRQDVQRMAETYLSPAKMTFVVVGDKAKIEDSLKGYPPR
ncbi:MAG TPA: pitrilysin family protein [Bryobacteraceae bacterium]|nr:pitrilysin family protein [Bryobacteraceae bacterium]